MRGTVPPLVEFRGAPRTQIASTWVGHRFRPARSAFQRPAGLRSTRPPMRPKPHGGPSYAFALLQRHPSQTRTVPPTRRPARRTALPLLGFSALRHTLGRPVHADRGSIRGPGGPCARFGYLPHDLHRPSYRRAKRRSVLGLPPTGLLPRVRRELLSESLPSWRCRPLRRTVGCTQERDRLQGLALDTGPYRHRSLGDRPSLPSWGSPPQSLLPIRPGASLWSRGLPFHPASELTSQLGRVLGSREADGSAWPVSGLPALSGFVTS